MEIYMTYETLYRKYRSNDLSELVGQQHVIQTLSNAIRHDRLSHAYIFSGPRGTGKTSTARILAKMVNKTTENIVDCDICNKITAGNCIDVIEIDAASHTGVDHMRQLTEQVQFLPVEASCKVFIIDEVHMLSTGAFNALLKTLEEPPANVCFILATTELHKIPATIQSRAQTLHFRLLEDEQINAHLLSICEKEGYSIEDQALLKLINVANGGMRDALSLLDQLMSVCDDKKILIETISGLLGTVDESELQEFLSRIFDGDSSAHRDLKRYVDQGIDIFQLYEDIITFLHHVLLVQDEHPFTVKDVVVSDWLQWFCEQIEHLKFQATPGLVAQVALYSRISALKNGPIVRPKSPEEMVITQEHTSHSPNLKHDHPPANSVVPDSDKIASTVAPQATIEKPTVSNLSKQVVSGNVDICDQVLQKISQEFQVLLPVLKGAKLIENSQVLYLVLDETYQFFEKKLAEDKFKHRFLDAYNQLSNQSVSEWVVTADVNLIYNQKKNQISGTIQSDNQTPTQSKTINQIIEMFDGQIIK